MMTLLGWIKRIAISFFIIFYLINDPIGHAESMSNRVSRLRGKSCTDNIGQTKLRINSLEQLLSNIDQMQKHTKKLSPQSPFIHNSRDAKIVLTDLLTALTNHNRAKQTICEQLGPVPGDVTSGYKKMSKSDRIRRIRTDYCTTDKQNGEVIRRKIPLLKTAMEKMLGANPSDKSLYAPMQQLQGQWPRIEPIIDDVYNEQLLAKKICKNIAQGLSKSELIRTAKKGNGDGQPIPYFLYLITYQ